MMDSYFIRVLLTPSAVFLSVVFGPTYSSGAAVTQFVSINGPSGGLVSILTIAVVFALILSLSFELARLFKAYEYASFTEVLLKRGRFLYEIVILMGIVIGLSIAITIGGAILEDHFGIEVWVGSLVIFALIVVLTFYGRKVVQKSMMLSVAALFVVLSVLVMHLLGGHVDQIVQVFSGSDHQKGGVLTGLKYAIANGGFLPLLLYCAVGLRSRTEAFVAGALAATVAVLPALVFHFAVMVDYPGIIDERVPIYRMFEVVSTPAMLNVYVLVMFVLIAQTGVGLQQGLVERLDKWQVKRSGAPLKRGEHAAVAVAVAGVSVALGSMGVVALILRAYTLMFICFIVVFIVPLFTYGAYLIFRRRTNPG
jgi:uncharacterized membrane protein YkvI